MTDSSLRSAEPHEREEADLDSDDHGEAPDRDEPRRQEAAAKRDDEDAERKATQPHRDFLDLRPAETEEADQGEGKDEAKKGGKEERGIKPVAPPKWLFVAAAVVLLLLVGWGGYKHWRAYKDSSDTVAETNDRPLEVRTVAAERLDKPIPLTLPGETQAFDTANVYARATGYVTERNVDIGSRVRKGDLLIHISAPDLDQQLAQAEAQIGQTRAALIQAEAQVKQSEANVNLAQVNFARTNQLTQQGYESQQNRDQRQADLQTQQANVESAKAGVHVAEANVKAQEATIDRLKALTSFEDVRAPFDGTVTARNVDLGELINADTTTGSPIFTLVHDDVIRTLVRIPQSLAGGVHDGLEARIVVPQEPDRNYAGRVQRSSVALLYSSRTLTTEVDVPNKTGDLRPGLYVTVTIDVPREKPTVSVPAEALIYNQSGMQVAVVEGDTVHLHKVNVDKDHGTTIDLRSGVEGEERVVLNPPATLKDGAKVEEKKSEDDKKAPDQKAPGNQQAKADTDQKKP